MRSLRFLLLTLVATAWCMTLRADDAAAVREMEPWMTKRGKLLFSEQFTKPALVPTWNVSKGTWDVVDGALKGVELEKDHHAAAIRHPIALHNAIFQFAFQFDGAKVIHFSINGKQGHVCRVMILPNGFTVRRDKPNKQSSVAPAVLGQVKYRFKPGQWYRMLVEVQGDEMLARIDDQVYAFGEASGLDQPKTNFGFPTTGDGAHFDDVMVWDALPNPDWSATQKKLAAQRPKQSPVQPSRFRVPKRK